MSHSNVWRGGRWIASALTMIILLGSFFAQAQTARGVASPRPVTQVDRVLSDAGGLSTLQGHVPAWATPENLSATPVNQETPLHLFLLLKRSAAAQAAFEQLTRDQQMPGSAVYHRAVSPALQGTLYGPTQHDVQAIQDWAQSEGLTVGALSPNRTTLELRGTVATAEAAFHTRLSNYTLGSHTRLAVEAEPQVPSEFTPVIAGIGGLVEEDAQPLFTGAQGNHFITPADFATIYDVNPIYTAGNTGATIGGKPQHIAILGSSDANLTDIQAYFAGIGTYQPSYNTFLADGTDPGYVGSEAELDIERVLGTAPGVTVDFVIGNSNQPIYAAAQYAVNTLQDPIITVSFGECEAVMSAATLQLWSNLWSTAAANMTSVFVASGDSGAAACDAHGSQAPPNQSRSVNGFASTAYNTAVGGTEFNDTANPSQYWSSTNNQTTKASALGYIPEGVWNDPISMDINGNVTYLVRAGGGGASATVTKPSWQTGPGVPNDGYRDLPDLALTASASHDAYFACVLGKCTVATQSNPSTFVAFGDGGTSASTPSMAGIAALLNTAAGTPQGNLSPMLYRLAASAATSQIFHDVTLASAGFTSCDLTTPSLCNNSTPGPNSLQGGQQGFVVGPGYDQATGLGSLDVANFIKAAIPPATSLQLAVNGSALSLSQSTTLTATLSEQSQSLAAPTGTIQFYVNGVASGTPVALSGSTATSAAITFAAPGTYTIAAAYSGDALYQPSTSTAVTVYVAASVPAITLSASPSTLTFPSGATSGNSVMVAVTGTNNYAGTVALSCTISSSNAANQPTCSVSPASVTLTQNGSSSAVVSIASTSAHASLIPLGIGGQRQSLAEAGVGLFASTLIFGVRRRRNLFICFCALVVASTCFLSLSGCSGNSAPLQSSAGTYTVTVAATGTGNGALAASSASTTFTVAIQ